MAIAVQGTMPDMEQMMAVRNAMIQATDLRQPMNLGDQLLHSSGLSNDVGLAMMNLLQVPETSCSLPASYKVAVHA